MTTEEEIARSRENVELANEIAGIVFDEIKRVWPDLHPLLDLRYGIADRVIALPLLNRVRAEGAAEALESAADEIKATFADPDRRRPKHPMAEVATDYVNDAQWAELIVRQRAQAIEQNSEGEQSNG